MPWRQNPWAKYPSGSWCVKTAPYLSGIDASPNVRALAEEIGRETSWETTSFLWTLTRSLMETISSFVRHEGEPQLPLVTLSQGQGACRDYTVLFLEVCRVVELAGRFVSGYYGGDLEQTERHLHAWAFSLQAGDDAHDTGIVRIAWGSGKIPAWSARV